MKRRTRQAGKARRKDRREQAKADRDVRDDWLAAIHGEREDLELLARDDATGKAAREAVLALDEVPDGVTHTMLRDACLRALERSMIAMSCSAAWNDFEARVRDGSRKP